MYGNGSHSLQYQEESEEEYDVFAEAERDMVVKTFSKESATTRIQWNGKREQEELDRYRELVVVHSTDSPETSTKATQKSLPSRSPRFNNDGPAGVLFSSIASSIASQDSSARMNTKSASSHAGVFTSGSRGMSNKMIKNVDMGSSQKRMDTEAATSNFTSGPGEDTESRGQHLKKGAVDRTAT